MTNEDKVNEAYDDLMYTVSKAKKFINKKKKDQSYFKKLQKECELYYKENQELFGPVSSSVMGVKLNLETNQLE